MSEAGVFFWFSGEKRKEDQVSNRFEVIKEHFEQEAKVFDKNFMRFAPYYQEAIEALVSAMPFKRDQQINILDLGCGTGNIAKAALEQYPRASAVCIDLSKNMIELAKAKLKKYKNVEFCVCDIREFKFDRKFDAVISSLVLHHMEGDDKKRFYKKIYHSLNKGGVFWNADVTLGSTQCLQEMYIEKWIAFMRKGCSPSEIKRTLKNYKAEDRPAKLMDELKLLAEAGFKGIDVIRKWYCFSVYGGIK
jgi:tRNA (cmo5U34)-methyltransferase